MVKKAHWILPALVLLAVASPLWADDSSNQPGLLSFDIGSAIWVLVSFSILLAILTKTAWKPALAALQAREERIRGDIRNAEEARAKAEATLKQYAAQLATAEEQVRQMLAKAVADGEKIAANIRTQAQAEGEAEREKTRKEIEAAKRQAIREVYDQTADLATTIASKIIGRALIAKDQQDLVAETLGQLETMNKA
jgi:F-type H+-transporting ATPase subunit b